MRASGRCLGSLLLLAPAWIAAQPAASDLLEVDLDEPGDGLVTRDTTAGLDWLDPVLSTGLSFEEVEADVGGFVPDGWRHAEGEEVCRLFEALGEAPTPCPGGTVDVVFEDVSEHFRLLGRTSDPGALELQGLAGVYEDGGAADRAGLAEMVLSGLGGSAGDLSILDAAIAADDGDDHIGHLLVRPVPEPRAAWAVPVVLAVLSALRHRWPARVPRQPTSTAEGGTQRGSSSRHRAADSEGALEAGVCLSLQERQPPQV